MKKMMINNDTIYYNNNCIDVMKYMVNNNITVDLTITSPPYDDIRTYGNKDEWYFDKFKDIARLLYEITNDGGTVVWVVGDQVKDGSETGTSFRQALYFMECGFKLHDTMIYEKNSSSFPAKRNSKRYTQIFEYMFVFTKGKIKTGNLICDKENKWKGWTCWGQHTAYNKEGELKPISNIKPIPDYSPRTNIWKYSVGFNVNTGKHSAVFPFKLAEDNIISWSNEGDIVFDPFLGSGTTMFAALKNNRKFIGCEINEDYIKSYQENLKQYEKRWIAETNQKNQKDIENQQKERS